VSNFKRIDIAGPVQDLVKELHSEQAHDVEFYLGFHGWLQTVQASAEDTRMVIVSVGYR